MTLKVVDAAVLYTHPFTFKTYILLIWNALYVPSLQTNLIPPFVLQEHGITVNDVPQIQLADPFPEEHAIVVDQELTIPLLLNGKFSYFPTRKPTLEELQQAKQIYSLTPEEFNLHNSAYSQNEENMLA